MAEELRFFLRTALYSLVAGGIYWFVSYEWAGTFLFGFVFVGAAFFTVAVGAMIRETRSEAVPEDAGGSKILAALDRTLGFEEHPGDASAAPLAVEDEVIPPASIWPLAAASASLLVGLGLIYGAWFWIPGGVLAITTAYGWATELTS